LQGLYYALIEGRFLFDFVHQEDLSAQTLQRYRALLVPNAAYLSDGQCRQIREYVAGGGSLFATFETSLYDEWGERRREFGLADLFGASASGDVVGPTNNSYMRIEQRSPITSGFDGTTLLPGPENRVPITVASGEPLTLTVVPSYPAFPPEMVIPREPKTKEPAAIFRQRGRSRIAYLAGDVDRTFWLSTNTDLGRLLRNAVGWVRGEAPPLLSLDGPGVIEAFAWETEPGYALHLVNYTNPHMMRGWVRELYPVGPMRVEWRLPEGRSITKAQGLRAGRSLTMSQGGGRVLVEIPSITDYEVIALT
jgi:hypothetical protein